VLLQQVDTDFFVSRCAMSRTFNAVMRVISSLIGVLLVLMGGIWILQGLNLAWGSLSRSFMQGDQHWLFYGAIMLIVGVCQSFGATPVNGNEIGRPYGPQQCSIHRLV
jgi:hypothetical protein